MFPNYAPPGVAAHAFLTLCSVISFCGGRGSWLANSPMGFQHEAVFLNSMFRVFRLVLSMNVEHYLI